MRLKKIKGVWQEKNKVLFPGYVIVDTETPEEVEGWLEQILPEKAQMLYRDCTYAFVSEEGKKLLEGLSNERHLIRPSAGYIVDGHLQVMAGSLREYETYIEKMERHKRTAQILLKLCGLEQQLLLGLEAVARVTRAEFEQMMVGWECVSA